MIKIIATLYIKSKCLGYQTLLPSKHSLDEITDKNQIMLGLINSYEEPNEID